MSDLQSTPETRRQCRHILPAGRRCLAPCLRTRDFCFFHQTSRPPRRPRPLGQPQGFFIPRPEDRASIQLALGDILERLAASELDPRRARLMLYALQIASHNLPRPLHPTLEPGDDPTDGFVDDIAEHPTLGPIALEAPFQPASSNPAPAHAHHQRLYEDLLVAGWTALPDPLPLSPPHSIPAIKTRANDQEDMEVAKDAETPEIPTIQASTTNQPSIAHTNPRNPPAAFPYPFCHADRSTSNGLFSLPHHSLLGWQQASCKRPCCE